MLFPYLDLATTFAQLAILVVYVISLFRFSDYIRPACLVSDSSDYSFSDVCQMPGWGKVSSKDSF